MKFIPGVHSLPSDVSKTEVIPKVESKENLTYVTVTKESKSVLTLAFESEAVRSLNQYFCAVSEMNAKAHHSSDIRYLITTEEIRWPCQGKPSTSCWNSNGAITSLISLTW